MTNVKIMVGDVLARLGDLPDRSVHCCVTSPPYWSLRDYGTASWDGGDPECDHQETRGGTGASSSKQGTSGGTQGYQFKDVCGKCGAQRGDKQIGLEPTVEEYIEKLTAVFEEVRRVLRDDGTCFINMGDCYAGGGRGQGSDDCKQRTNKGSCSDTIRAAAFKRPGGLKPKDLVGQPWMLAFALRSAGWYLRSEIIWHKLNPMPESCTDRPTKSHEKIFLLSKKPRYFYDQEAVKEKSVEAASGNKARKFGAAKGGNPDHNSNQGWSIPWEGATRNLRDVWKIATQSFPEAHFATFPEELPRKCILAGTSEKGCCPKCGAPWMRVVEKTRTHESGSGKSGNPPAGKHGANLQGGGETGDIRNGPCVSSETIGWRPGCQCHEKGLSPEQIERGRSLAGEPGVRRTREWWDRADPNYRPIPCIVLDPFGGAGTTALVASKMGRNAILTELSPKYANMAADRIRRECGLLATVTVDELETVIAGEV